MTAHKKPVFIYDYHLEPPDRTSSQDENTPLVNLENQMGMITMYAMEFANKEVKNYKGLPWHMKHTSFPNWKKFLGGPAGDQNLA